MTAVAPLILAVDDDPSILRLLRLQLSTDGFQVIGAKDGEEALRLAEAQRPDLIILDVVMANMDGLEVLRRVRERSDVPVLLLTARDRGIDVIEGLDQGADDYLIKPFHAEELAARVRALLRRTGGRTESGESVVRYENIEVDLESRAVTKDGKPVALSRMEWLLLHELASNPGKLMLNTELLSKIWGPEFIDDVQYLRVCVSRLRSKLEDDASNPRVITTMPGLG
jgi:two-component system KDP operon response regulator KdpE